MIKKGGPLAQLVEQGTLNPKVEGSTPSWPIISIYWHIAKYERL